MCGQPEPVDVSADDAERSSNAHRKHGGFTDKHNCVVENEAYIAWTHCGTATSQ